MKKKILCVVMLLFVCINVNAQIITTVAGSGPYGLNGGGGSTGSYTGDGGQATIATLNGALGITIDTLGNIFIEDQNHSRIRKINTVGIINTYAGNGNYGNSGDGGPATAAEFKYIDCIICDRLGNLYIPDYSDSKIRKINAASIVSTYAGDSIFGHTGDGGPANVAKIGSVTGITFDTKGNMYYGDITGYIMKINTAGILTTIGGKGVYGYGGDGGPATNALLKGPVDLALDKKGNIYISDVFNDKIRKIDTNGIISTYAGADTLGGYSGDG